LAARALDQITNEGTIMPDELPPLPPDGIAPGPPRVPPLLPQDQADLKPQTRAQLPPMASMRKNLSKMPGPGDMKDGTREVIETIVFVVVLVLLLKTFLAEAFVIPTGSMATTLLGYHREVTCNACGYRYLTNASSEGEDREPYVVTKCYCPNCRYLNVLRPQIPPGEMP
jgi:hypothetical protein